MLKVSWPLPQHQNTPAPLHTSHVQEYMMFYVCIYVCDAFTSSLRLMTVSEIPVLGSFLSPFRGEEGRRLGNNSPLCYCSCLHDISQHRCNQLVLNSGKDGRGEEIKAELKPGESVTLALETPDEINQIRPKRKTACDPFTSGIHVYIICDTRL